MKFYDFCVQTHQCFLLYLQVPVHVGSCFFYLISNPLYLLLPFPSHGPPVSGPITLPALHLPFLLPKMKFSQLATWCWSLQSFRSSCFRPPDILAPSWRVPHSATISYLATLFLHNTHHSLAHKYLLATIFYYLLYFIFITLFSCFLSFFLEYKLLETRKLFCFAHY